jgi:tRNA(Glu) U13 pseudouridine synthase TruD
MAEMGLDYDAFGFLRSHPGGRRPLRLPVVDAAVEMVEAGVPVSFELGAGSYATTLLRLLLEDPPWFGGRD